MSLFEKKQKLKVTCAKCGKEHTVSLYSHKFFLDGTPTTPIDKLMESVEICDCGMIVSAADWSINVMERPGYNKALLETDTTLRKMKLLYAATGDDIFLTYFANYYRSRQDYTKEKEYLMLAIQAIETERDRRSLIIHRGEFLSVKTECDFYFYADERLVDLYRRAEEYSKALKQIEVCRNKTYNYTPFELLDVLIMEERLINTRNHVPA